MRYCLVFFIALLTAGALASGGCAGAQKRADNKEERVEKRRRTALQEAADGFFKYMAWQRWERAGSFVPAGESRIQFLKDMREGRVKVTEFHILKVELTGEDEKEAVVTTSVTGVRQSDLVVVTEEYQHKWFWDGADNQWYVYYPYVSGRDGGETKASPSRASTP